jgi:hypothetical protein
LQEGKDRRVKRILEPWLNTAFNMGNWMQLQNTVILATKSRYIDCTMTYTTKIHPKTSNMNNRMLSA